MTVQEAIRREALFAQISLERDAQEAKFGGQGASPANPALSAERCLAILVEEVGEVANALLDGKPTASLAGELVQVAAVAVAWLEALIIRAEGSHAD